MRKLIILIAILMFTNCLISQTKKPYRGYALDILKSENNKLTELTPELNLCFNSWKDYLNVKQIFNIPKDDICKEYENGNLEYDFSKKNMPLKISFVKYLKFKSKETEYFFIKYELDNCLRGNAYYRDFVIFTRKGNKIEFDTTFTNQIKNDFKQTIFDKLDIKLDELCFTDENSNFVHTDGLIILDFIDDNIIGKYALQGNGANCCPQYSGDFEYSISNNKMILKNGFFENQDFENNETIEYDNPSVNKKTKNHPKNSKNKLVISSIQITREEKEALRQFIGFCKIQVDIEDQKYRYSTGYTVANFEALNFKKEVTAKSDIKSKLDEVLTNNEIRNSFLTYYAKITSNDFERLCMLISPPDYDNRYLAKVSKRQSEILANCILKKFRYTPIKLEEDNDKESIAEQKDVPVLTVVEKTAEYIGGKEAMIKFIGKNLILPKSDSTSNEETHLRIFVNFIVEKDGTISNIKIDKSGYETEKYENCIIQCFQKMPKWKPAEQSGKPIRISWREPVIISTSN